MPMRLTNLMKVLANGDSVAPGNGELSPGIGPASADRSFPVGPMNDESFDRLGGLPGVGIPNRPFQVIEVFLRKPSNMKDVHFFSQEAANRNRPQSMAQSALSRVISSQQIFEDLAVKDPMEFMRKFKGQIEQFKVEKDLQDLTGLMAYDDTAFLMAGDKALVLKARDGELVAVEVLDLQQMNPSEDEEPKEST